MSANNVDLLDRYLKKFKEWRFDVWLFLEEALGVLPAEPLPDLINTTIDLPDNTGRARPIRLFDDRGLPAYSDLNIYTKEMFRYNASKEEFKQRAEELAKEGMLQLTWQQTLEMVMYQRAILTFKPGSHAPDIWRYITIRSGHGVGKTSFLSMAMMHFLLVFFGAQISVTANTENQLKDIFLKEFAKWKMRLPDAIRENVKILDNMVRIGDDPDVKDWFMRLRVARKENLEALAGLHGDYVAVVVDEASGVDDQVFEVLFGALTGKNHIVIYTSNPTRAYGEFYRSHRPTAHFSQLKLNSEDSPIVEDGYIETMRKKYGADSLEYRVRVLGEFPSEAGMDEDGWVPFSANININFMPEQNQPLKGVIIGVDPAGDGKDKTVVVARDKTAMRIALEEAHSTPKDGANKVALIAQLYNTKLSNIGIDAFGVGAEWIANMPTDGDDRAVALLTDKPKVPEGQDKNTYPYKNYMAELAWKFREWLRNGGIIITDNPNMWLRELENMKYRRNDGKIEIMSTVQFKKEYGFSPDHFKAACYSFHRDEPVVDKKLTPEEREALMSSVAQEIIAGEIMEDEAGSDYSSI